MLSALHISITAAFLQMMSSISWDQGGKMKEALATHFELDLSQSSEVLARFWKTRPWREPFADAVG